MWKDKLRNPKLPPVFLGIHSKFFPEMFPEVVNGCIAHRMGDFLPGQFFIPHQADSFCHADMLQIFLKIFAGIKLDDPGHMSVAVSEKGGKVAEGYCGIVSFHVFQDQNNFVFFL